MKSARMFFLERLLIVGVVLALCFSFSNMKKKNIDYNLDELESFSSGWYRLENGKKVSVDVPSTLELENSQDDLILYNDTLDHTHVGHAVTTRSAAHRIQIFLDDQLLYQYNDDSFPRNLQMRMKLNCTAELVTDPAGKQLSIVYENLGDGIFTINPIYIGTYNAVFRQHYNSDIFTILIIFIMGIIGVICAGCQIYVHHLHMHDHRLFHISMFLLLSCTWCTLDSGLAQHISNLSPAVCTIAFTAFMSMIIPMLHFICNTANMGKYKSLNLCIILCYVNLILQPILNIALGYEFIDMLWVTHMLQGAICLYTMILLFREYQHTSDRELRAMLQSVALLAFASIIDIFLYWKTNFPNYGMIFECGIIIFIVRLLSAILLSLNASLRFKTEASIYKKLSREDRLTGLGNRRGFEEFITRLQISANTYGNIGLIFLDLNYLKTTNDQFGHAAGDDLIIAAARCIRKCFGDQGECYRMGGDEFAVILPDPNASAEDWSNCLSQEISRYNLDCQHPLSISWGISFLRREDGTLKKLSDWKYEADQEMYKSKSKLHASKKFREENQR